MDQDKREQIVSILDDVNDMTIATNREDGFPQATTVSYLSDGLTIYFIAGADAQKARNIARDNKVSLTVNRRYETWDQIESLSMGALATRVEDETEVEKIGQLLMNKFPQAVDYDMGEDVEFAYFRVEPKVISLLDYSKGFGHTELIEL